MASFLLWWRYSNVCCPFLFRSAYSFEPSFIYSEILIRVDCIDKNPKRTPHISTYVNNLRRFAFQLRRLRYDKVKQSAIHRFVYRCAFLINFYCSLVVYPGLFKKDTEILHRRPVIIGRMSFIPLCELSIRLHDEHPSAYEKFTHNLLPDPTHSLHNDLSKCRTRISTRSAFRSILRKLNIYWNRTVPYFARILTIRGFDSISLLNNLY